MGGWVGGCVRREKERERERGKREREREGSIR